VTARSRGALCVLLACALASPAAAQAPAGDAARRATAKKLAQKATRKYNLGQYRDALDGYTRAYDTFPAPGLLFNIGQCHRGLGDHEQAIRSYEAYLREQPDASNRTLVEELLAEEEGLLKTQRQAEAARAAEERAAEERARAEEAERARAAREKEEREKSEREARERAALPPPAPIDSTPPASPRGSVFKKWWFWTAVGAVALAGGGALYLNAQRDEILPSGSLGTHDQR
jgi:tetratricopeptide (TPR) repeat protein